MTVNDTRKTVGRLVVERPDRAQFFDQLGIDYSCEGKTPLAKACAEHGLDQQTVFSELQSCDRLDSPPATDDWEPSTLGGLIDRIVAVHHGHLRRELPRLAAMAEKVVEAHGREHPELGELREIFVHLKNDLERHMVKEEWAVFPLIRQLEAAADAHEVPTGLNPLILGLEHDHLGAAGTLTRMRRVTGGYKTPPEACPLYRALLGGLAGLEADLHHHVHEENNLLFPRARALAASLLAGGRGASGG